MPSQLLAYGRSRAEVVRKWSQRLTAGDSQRSVCSKLHFGRSHGREKETRSEGGGRLDRSPAQFPPSGGDSQSHAGPSQPPIRLFRISPLGSPREAHAVPDTSQAGGALEEQRARGGGSLVLRDADLDHGKPCAVSLQDLRAQRGEVAREPGLWRGRFPRGPTRRAGSRRGLGPGSVMRLGRGRGARPTIRYDAGRPLPVRHGAGRARPRPRRGSRAARRSAAQVSAAAGPVARQA